MCRASVDSIINTRLTTRTIAIAARSQNYSVFIVGNTIVYCPQCILLG